MPKIIVAGGREFNNFKMMEEKLDQLFHKIVSGGLEVVSGTAYGADKLGERYATSRGLNILRFPPDWNKYGKAAGYIRNVEMAKNANGLVAFWDGESKGTAHMIQVANVSGLNVRVVRYKMVAPG